MPRWTIQVRSQPFSWIIRKKAGFIHVNSLRVPLSRQMTVMSMSLSKRAPCMRFRGPAVKKQRRSTYLSIRHGPASSAGRQLVALASDHAVCVASSGALIAIPLSSQSAGSGGGPKPRTGLSSRSVSVDKVLRMWRLDAVDDLSLMAYGNDNPDGPDLLGIAPGVDALAALVCAKTIQPPLSVGLFGTWGSGKSFFMRKLQRRVEEIVEDAKESGRVQRSLWSWRNVAGSLQCLGLLVRRSPWAGLLEKLIQELAAPSKGKLELPTELDEIKRRRLQRMIVTKSEFDQLHADRDDARRALDEAQRTAAVAEAKLKAEETRAASAIEAAAARAAGDALIKAASQALAPLGVGDAATAVDDVRAQLSAAKERFQSISGLVRANNGWLIVVALIASPVIALVAGVVVKHFEPSLAGITVAIGAITTLLGGAAAWIRRGVTWIDAQLKPIQEAEAEAARVHSSLVAQVAALMETRQWRQPPRP